MAEDTQQEVAEQIVIRYADEEIYCFRKRIKGLEAEKDPTVFVALAIEAVNSALPPFPTGLLRDSYSLLLIDEAIELVGADSNNGQKLNQYRIATGGFKVHTRS